MGISLGRLVEEIGGGCPARSGSRPSRRVDLQGG